jgi:hypothetical protein
MTTTTLLSENSWKRPQAFPTIFDDTEDEEKEKREEEVEGG